MKVSAAILPLLLSAICGAQETAAPPGAAESTSSLGSRLWLSAQFNVVNQSHPAFDAAYSGPNSFSDSAGEATTWVATLYTGFALSKHTEFLFDLESARGAGVSGALGLGGLPDLDAVTQPHAPATPYVARLQLHQVIPLGGKLEDVTRSPLGLATSLPSRRLEIRVGKMSVTDFFDLNSIGSDSHLQFLNYAIDNNAAYDFAANSRGYTYGVLLEFYHPGWVVRFGEMLEPTDPTGLHIQWNLARAHSENYEIELHPNWIPKRSGIYRVLGFVNHADLGSYPEAVSAYLAGRDPTPDLLAHVRPGQLNYGFGFNGEQEVTESLRLFGRYGWNEGSHEAFQFAEADRTITLGADFGGKKWHRSQDRVGAAVAIDGISSSHREYLELGGVSYLLGDGGLKYGRETVAEGYYNFRIHDGIFTAVDVQRVQNPGYNERRGPIWVIGVRLHLEGDVHFN